MNENGGARMGQENEEDGDQGTNGKRCKECRRELQLGDDCIVLERGVIGPRGVVPLDDLIFFCGDDCSRSYFDVEEVRRERLRRRVP